MAASQEFSFMLASPANQLTDAESTVAEHQSRTTNILSLEFSGAQHEPVLLSPGKWNVGSDASNQIVLNGDDIAARQFLIIVTKHRSVIKDWSTKALCNGSLFDSAVLGDGDSVEVADVRLSFRLAESQDLIAQLPYVSEPNCPEETGSAIDNDVVPGQCEGRNTVHVTADGMLSFEDGADQLDELIGRIESSLASEVSGPANLDSDVSSSRCGAQETPSRFAAEMWPSDVESGVAASQSGEHDLELQAGGIDEELRQLEELRAAVQLEREQLLAKRELLIQETQQVEAQLAEARQRPEVSTANDEEVAVDEDGCKFEEQPSDDSGVYVENEDGAVAAEREKLRHYLEEFESVDDAECEQLEEVEVAVGAAQAVSDHSVMNALRSRDDAVKQLDDLVLAATGGLPAQPSPASNPLFDAATNDQTRESSGSLVPLAESESESVGHNDVQNDSDESAEDVDTAPDLESSIEEIGELINEVETAETLTDEVIHESPAHDSESLSDFAGAEDTVSLNEQTLIETSVPDDAGTIESPDEYDLSALTTGIDAEAAESDVSLAENGEIPHVEFDDGDANDPSFEDAAIEEYSGASDRDVTALSESDDAVDLLSLQNSDSYGIVEEPSAECSGEVDLTEPELAIESEGAELQPTDLEANCDYTEPDSQETGLNFGQADAGAPSWFDSKLMAEGEGDSEVDNETLVDHAVSDDVAAEDAAAVDVDSSAIDLRQKLAEMFDLPTLSENTETVSPDSSLESRLQMFRDEQSTEDVAEVDSDVPSSSWPDISSTDTSAESDFEIDFDPSGVSETESDSQFESETLDDIPATAADQRADTSELSAKSAGSLFEPAEQEEEEDSITTYMERLLARNRQVTGGSSASVESNVDIAAATPESDPSASSINQDQSADGTVETESQPEKWLDKTPRHRQDRDQVRAEVQVLRQIANQSARSAVATASRREVRKQVIVKTTASILALGSGVAALLLDISMPFGLVVLGIGMLFSIDLGLTIFRNWKQLRDLQKAAAALEHEAGEVDAEAVPVTT
jgi:hypothetical protein